MRGDGARSREVGLDGYLTKPVKQSELYNAVNPVLNSVSVNEEKPLVTQHYLQESMRRLDILLVEDNPINRQLAMALLAKRGAAVAEAENGREALEALAKHDYDLVLMDVQMPEMDGFEATQAIRKREEETGKHVPIVAMTAHALKGDRERCLACGMDDYLAKPIKRQDLFQLLDRYSQKLPAEEACPPVVTPAAKQAAQAANLSQAAPVEEESDTVDLPSALDRADGDRQLVSELLYTFSHQAPQFLTNLQAALGRADYDLIQKTAHTLKGASANLSCNRLRWQAERLEQLAKNHGELAQLKPEIEQLSREFENLAVYLQAHGAAITAPPSAA
jgi:CheY-like chemotaxis protein/HPt (histidine-containing phosphotransfer) domain-containing protein